MNQTRSFLLIAWLVVATLLWMEWSKSQVAPPATPAATSAPAAATPGAPAPVPGLAAPGSALYGVLAAQLALLSGVVLLVCGLLRIGFLANFFSRPVMSGFTIGSAILIAWGQVRPLFGALPPAVHWPSTALGLGALAVLVWARHYMAGSLRRLGLPAM